MTPNGHPGLEAWLDRWFPWLAAAALAANLSGLWLPLLDDDPALYAAIARAMADSGDFVRLTYGGVEWLDKPHFPFWMAALSFRAFGVSAAAYRLPALAFWGLGVLYTFLLVPARCERRVEETPKRCEAHRGRATEGRTGRSKAHRSIWTEDRRRYQEEGTGDHGSLRFRLLPVPHVLTTSTFLPTSAAVDLTALVHNLTQLRKTLVPGCNIMAVVKANAYGHGAVETAKALLHQGVSRIAVVSIEEGITLRHAGINLPIVILGPIFPEQFTDLFAHQLTPVE